MLIRTISESGCLGSHKQAFGVRRPAGTKVMEFGILETVDSFHVFMLPGAIFHHFDGLEIVHKTANTGKLEQQRVHSQLGAQGSSD